MGYADNIVHFRKKRGLTQAQLAAIVEVEQPTVQRWERGMREPTIAKLKEIADALGVSLSDLLAEDVIVPVGPRLYVKGEVAAGAWKEAVEWSESDWQHFSGRSDVKADLQHRFGLRVVGDSMNLLYPEGAIVECVSLFGRAEASPGRRVVIVRRNVQNQFEATVKELVEGEDGKLWAVPKSTNPAHRPFCLSEPEDGIIETRITAVVVGSYRPE